MRNFALHQAQQSDMSIAPGILARLWQNWQSRRELARLTRFDDHMLRDIGLTRHSLHTALNVSLTDDPYARLGQVSPRSWR
ncbi:MAG: DUF1127 domain-containing protein [Rhizobiales bacterium]|nr:DUF1127 domain-containing protein [Hyphomicrobiales bacterium]